MNGTATFSILGVMPFLLVGGESFGDPGQKGMPLVKTDADLARLKSRSDIRAIRIESSKVTDNGLRHLKKIPDLKALELGFNNPGITELGMAHLKGLKLKHLHLTGKLFLGGNVRANGLTCLEHLPDLRSLSLYGTEFGDGCLRFFRPVKSLQKLTLEDHAFTESGLQKLKAMLPKCEIRIDP